MCGKETKGYKSWHLKTIFNVYVEWNSGNQDYEWPTVLVHMWTTYVLVHMCLTATSTTVFSCHQANTSQCLFGCNFSMKSFLPNEEEKVKEPRCTIMNIWSSKSHDNERDEHSLL